MRSDIVLRLGIGALLALVVADVEAQPSRAATSASYVERGNEWMKKGEIERAIADYDLAIVTDAQSAAAHYNRGVARRQKGDLSGAVSDWNRTMELNPRCADAYLNRG